MLKYLRITVTALSLTACVLLIALWVRSYWIKSSLNYYDSSNRWYALRVYEGRVALSLRSTVGCSATFWYVQPDFEGEFSNPFLGFYFDNTPLIVIPMWFTTSPFAVLAILRWVPLRYSLRTMLIATALVAVGLAIIVVTS